VGKCNEIYVNFPGKIDYDIINVAYTIVDDVFFFLEKSFSSETKTEKNKIVHQLEKIDLN